VVRPRNTASLAARLREARVPAQARGEARRVAGPHHGILVAGGEEGRRRVGAGVGVSLSVSFRRKAPVLAEMSAFLHQHAGARRLTTLRRSEGYVGLASAERAFSASSAW
jgi:hypothetical protein